MILQDWLILEHVKKIIYDNIWHFKYIHYGNDKSNCGKFMRHNCF